MAAKQDPGSHTSLITPVVVALLLLVNLALALWMLQERVADLPWLTGEPGPTCDFVVHYGAGWMARHGEAAAAYDELAYGSALRDILPSFDERMLWMHPPPALLGWTPFSSLPYPVAYLVWVLLSTVSYAWMALKVTGSRWALVAAPLFAGFTLDFVYAQNGAVLTAMLAAGMVMLKDRPVLAALPLGYLTVKPHWAPVVLLALLAGRRWRALVATLGTAVVLYAVSLGVFGVDTWAAFLSQLDAGFKLIPHLAVHDLMSPYSALLPLHPGLASAVQTGCTLAALASVAWVWGRERSMSTRVAVLALALSVASPYLHFYDLAALGIAVAWLVRDALVQGDRMRAVMLFTLASSALWLFRIVGALFEVQLAPWFLLAALLILVRRP